MPHGRLSYLLLRLGHLTAAGPQRQSFAQCYFVSGYENEPPTHFTLGLFSFFRALLRGASNFMSCTPQGAVRACPTRCSPL